MQLSEQMSARHTIAVVNDDHVTLTRLTGLLDGEGFSVLSFTGAEEFFAAAGAAATADLIITDLHMPGIDGWRLVRLLRSDEYAAFNEIPILVVSATFSGSDTEEITEDIGADGFLESPVDGPELIERVRAILGGARAERNPRVLVVDDSRSLLELLGDAFAGDGYVVETAETVADARAAFAAGSFDVAVIDYHLPDGTGDELLARFRAADPDSVCIAITTDTDPGLAVSLMKQGLAAYVQKPFEPQYLLEVCRRARRERALLRVEELFEARTAELRESERQKSLLLREVHHRMKNDMQLVQGTLMLQAERCHDAGARRILDDAVSRVGVMARIYDTLYGREDFEYVAAPSVINTLAAGLRRTTLDGSVDLETDVEDLDIEAKLSTSIGLIINELVTNAAKHAFDGVASPRISVSLFRADEGRLRLTVRDNGVGMPEQARAEAAAGFGMEIVNALVEQHEGVLEVHTEDGTAVSAVLKL